MADISKTITLDVKTDRKKIDDLIKSLQKSQKIPIELTPNDKKVKSSVNDLKAQINSISKKEIDINVNTNIPEVTDDVKDLKTELEKKIELAIDTQKSATSIREFKKAQKELQGILLEIGDDGSKDFQKVAIAIGTGNDKIDELNDKIKSLSKAPIENLSAGFKGVKDSILNLNFEEFNDRVKNLGVVSKQVNFKDFSKSLLDTGKSFLTLGKLIATNPFGLLVTAIGLVVANFDTLKEFLGPLLLQFQLIGAVLGFVTDGFFALTDAIGLTTKAEDEATKSSIEASDKRKKSIQENLDAQEAYYSATKDLSDEEIKEIEEKTGIIIDNEKDILDIRIESNKKIIAENKLQLNELEEIQIRKGKLTDEESDKKDELVEEIQKANEKIIQSESDRLQKEKRFADLRQTLEIQAITDKDERAKAQAKKDKEEREEEIDIPKLEDDLKKASDAVISAETGLRNYEKSGALAEDAEFAKRKKAELEKLKQNVADKRKIIEDANGSLVNSEQIFTNTISEIDEGAAQDARNVAQAASQNRLKNLQDSQQVLINQTKEGSAERLAAEIELSKKTEEFVKSKGRTLGFTENEITLKIQEETKKREELEKRYNEEIIRLSNERNLSKANIDILEAKTLEERLKASANLIEEQSRQEIEELRRNITDKELLAIREREIILRKNEAIRVSNLQLTTEEKTSVIETGLLKIKNDADEVKNLKRTTDEKILEVKKLLKAEIDALKQREILEVKAANGNETKIAEIRERFRAARIDAERKTEGEIQSIRDENTKKLENAVNGLNDFISTTNDLTTKLGASINNLVGGLSNSLLNVFKVLGDETATQADKTIAYLQAAGAAIAGIGQVLTAISNQRLEEINIEEETAIQAADNEYNTQLEYINSSITDETQRKNAIDELDKGRAKAADDLRKKFAAIELAEKKKAFNQQKAISLVQAGIGTAQAVVQALTAGPIAGPILAGVVGALGAVQAAFIASQKFPEGGGGASTPPSPSGGGGGGGGGAPSPTPFQAPQFFGIGQQTPAGTQPPQPIVIQNNIVETDITSTQRGVNDIETRASIV